MAAARLAEGSLLLEVPGKYRSSHSTARRKLFKSRLVLVSASRRLGNIYARFRERACRCRGCPRATTEFPRARRGSVPDPHTARSLPCPLTPVTTRTPARFYYRDYLLLCFPDYHVRPRPAGEMPVGWHSACCVSDTRAAGNISDNYV